jgi:hypothetical protein
MRDHATGRALAVRDLVPLGANRISFSLVLVAAIVRGRSTRSALVARGDYHSL